jgi:hypothetical protein
MLQTRPEDAPEVISLHCALNLQSRIKATISGDTCPGLDTYSPSSFTLDDTSEI